MTSPETPSWSVESESGPIDPQNAALRYGHRLSFIGIFVFTFIVYSRPYEWSESLMWLATSALWVAISTVLVFVPTQLSLENRLTAPETEAKLVLLLLGAGLLSIPFASDPFVAWDQFVDYSKVVLVFIIMVNVLRTEWRLKVLLLLILSITTVLAIIAIKDYVLGNLNLEGVRIEGAIGGLFANPNDLALHFVTITPIALALSFGSRALLLKAVYSIAALAIMVAIIATFSRGGLLGLIVTVGVLTWRLARRHRGLLFAVLLPVFLVIPVLAGYSSRFSTTEGSAVARMDDLKRSAYVALHHPLFGIGLNNYILFSNNAKATHNAYTQVWVEMGTAAMVLYVAFLVCPLKSLRRIGNPIGDKKRDGINFLAVGLEASIWGYMVSSFFASVAYLWYVYYLIAFAICVRRLAPLIDVNDHTPLHTTSPTEEANVESEPHYL